MTAYREPVILCVDDEREMLSTLRRCFRNEPYQVLTAAGPEEALGWLSGAREVDLILADERMPGGSGTDLLREVRSRSPRTVRALLTGYPSEILIQRGLEAGVDTFLYKPFDDRVLRETVRRLVRPDYQQNLGRSDEGPFDLGGEG